MKALDIEKINNFVELEISNFHQKRLEYIEERINLSKILKQKNPYLFKAKNILTAQELLQGFLDAFLQSQEETIFGEFMERLAIFICSEVYGGKKSNLVGIDLEFEKENKIFIVEIKAGWNWGNSSQIKQLKINFDNAKKILQQKYSKDIIAVNGCCFGIDNKPEKKGYFKLCGQRFWEFISGNENLYIDIIKPIGYKAKQKNEAFLESYARIVNKLTFEFSKDFCDSDGRINWEKLIKFNSKK